MTDLTKLRAELRAGLGGVTPGPWQFVPHYFSNGDIKRRSVCVERSKYDWIDLIADLNNEADAAHIARCSPENVRALLDALDAAERERDEAMGIVAVIHRDGGHRAAEVGNKQAIDEAHVKWGELIRERDEARAELAKALDEAADEIDCGCPNRGAALAAESKADLWRACRLGTSCNARQAADIRSTKGRTP